MTDQRPEVLPALYRALYETYQDNRTGIHVSDIVLCPRKRVFRELEPKPITNIELNFFTSGKAIHAALQDLAKHNGSYEIEQEIYLRDDRTSVLGLTHLMQEIHEETKGEFMSAHNLDENNCISGHIDIYDRANNVPIEAKSMRKASVDKPKPHHVQQLKVYMAITGADYGIVLYQLLLHFDQTPFVEFVIQMTKDEREKMLDWLMVELHELRLAIKRQDPALARHVMLDGDYNFQCRNCPYLRQCQAINLRVDKNNVQGRNAKEINKG